MLATLARFSYRRKWLVILVMIGGLIVANIVGGAVGNDYRTDFGLPDSESKEAFDLVESVSPNQAGFTAQIVFRADQGVDDPEVQQAMEEFFDEIAALDQGVTVRSPYDEGGRSRSPASVTTPGASPSPSCQVSDRDYQDADRPRQRDRGHRRPDRDPRAHHRVRRRHVRRVRAARVARSSACSAAVDHPALRLRLGAGHGPAHRHRPVRLGHGDRPRRRCASNVMTMPDFAMQMAAMIGLGVGIDYALFIVTRYREGLHAGSTPEEATVEARRHRRAGRPVRRPHRHHLPVRPVRSCGLAFVPGLGHRRRHRRGRHVVASVTLLPALLGFAGRSIDQTFAAPSACSSSPSRARRLHRHRRRRWPSAGRGRR